MLEENKGLFNKVQALEKEVAKLKQEGTSLQADTQEEGKDEAPGNPHSECEAKLHDALTANSESKTSLQDVRDKAEALERRILEPDPENGGQQAVSDNPSQDASGCPTQLAKALAEIATLHKHLDHEHKRANDLHDELADVGAVCESLEAQLHSLREQPDILRLNAMLDERDARILDLEMEHAGLWKQGGSGDGAERSGVEEEEQDDEEQEEVGYGGEEEGNLHADPSKLEQSREEMSRTDEGLETLESIKEVIDGAEAGPTDDDNGVHGRGEKHDEDHWMRRAARAFHI